ncbi:MAG: hypothetical protein WDW38_002589 [Sanguina aurantia]
MESRILLHGAANEQLRADAKELDRQQALSVAHAAQRQHVTLAAALLEDDRLAALPVRLVLQEFVSEGLIHHSDSGSNLGDRKPVRNSAGSGPNCMPGSGDDSASGTSHHRPSLLPAAAAPAALPMLSGHRMSVDVMKKLRSARGGEALRPLSPSAAGQLIPIIASAASADLFAPSPVPSPRLAPIPRSPATSDPSLPSRLAHGSDSEAGGSSPFAVVHERSCSRVSNEEVSPNTEMRGISDGMSAVLARCRDGDDAHAEGCRRGDFVRVSFRNADVDRWCQHAAAGSSTPPHPPAPLPAIPTPLDGLEALVNALQQEIPGDAAQLRRLRQQRDTAAARLGWSHPTPPPTAERGPLVTAKARSLTALCTGLLDDILSQVMTHISMRPTREAVAAEVASWKVERQGALMGVARHMATTMLNAIVDEFIAEAYEEVNHLHGVSDAFAVDLLVEAIAHSQHRSEFEGEDVRSKLRVAAAVQEAELQRNIAARQKGTAARSRNREAAAAAAAMATSADSAAQQGGPPHSGVSASPPSRPAMADDDAYAMQRQFEDTSMARDEKQLYVMGLKGMLQEMRQRRGDAPYGHTQQLDVRQRRGGIKMSKAFRLATSRMRPPLAASAAVCRNHSGHRAKASLAPYPRIEHIMAAKAEVAFWGKVQVQHFLLQPGAKGKLPSVQVPRRYGPITVTSPSPSGSFLAVGTAQGGLLVWDLRNDEPSPPWFEVGGSGEVAARGLFGGRKEGAAVQQQPSVMALAWSADSYQLASVDVAHTLRMWWMRPEPGQSKDDTKPRTAGLRPDLGFYLSPSMVASSGKSVIKVGCHAIRTRLLTIR